MQSLQTRGPQHHLCPHHGVLHPTPRPTVVETFREVSVGDEEAQVLLG